MKKLLINLIRLSCLLILLSREGFSQSREQVFTGARPLGLGETFVAIADDGNAIYWNPAGLPTLRRMELNSMYGNLYGVGLKNGFLSGVLDVSRNIGLGLSYFHLGFGDDELEFFRDMVNLGGGYKYKNLHLGANIKYFWTDTQLESHSYGKASTVGFDVGGLFTLPMKKDWWLTPLFKQINGGFMLHDLNGTKIRFDESTDEETIYPQNLRYGFALFFQDMLQTKWKPLKWLQLQDSKLAFDFDDRFHAGAETWFNDILAVRGGLQKDLNTKEEMTFSMGGSIKVKSFQLDYAYVIPPVLPATHLFSISFARHPSPISIEAIEMKEIFASFYNIYSTEPIGFVTVQNNHGNELPIDIQFEIPDLKYTSPTETVKVGPDGIARVNLYAHFPNEILKIKEQPIFPSVDISVKYKIENQTKIEKKSGKLKINNRGAVPWERPDEAVAFITKGNRMIDIFTSEAIKNISYPSEIELSPIYQAAALFDALHVIQIFYKSDPNLPFWDNIKYPVESLRRKGGDCDDLTVLYASLLENVGIETALLSTERHITLMFNTGIHQQNWGVFPVRDSLAIVRRNSFWIPIEVQRINTSFQYAWEAGAKHFREWKSADYKIVFVRKVEGNYLATTPGDLQDSLIQCPNDTVLDQITKQDFSFIQKIRSEDAIAWHCQKLAQDSTNKTLRNRLGIIYAQQDSIIQAEQQFRTILKQAPDDMHALNNLANVYYIRGDLDSACQYYHLANQQNESVPGPFLNLSILYDLLYWQALERKDTTLSEYYRVLSDTCIKQAFDQLIAKYNSPTLAEKKAFELLGFTEDEGTQKAGTEEALSSAEKDTSVIEKVWTKVKVSVTELKKFVKKQARKHLYNKPLASATPTPKRTKEGMDKTRRYLLWWAYAPEEK